MKLLSKIQQRPLQIKNNCIYQQKLYYEGMNLIGWGGGGRKFYSGDTITEKPLLFTLSVCLRSDCSQLECRTRILQLISQEASMGCVAHKVRGQTTVHTACHMLIPLWIYPSLAKKLNLGWGRRIKWQKPRQELATLKKWRGWLHVCPEAAYVWQRRG